jgi:DNA sulfur modification protein DndC
MEAMVDNGEEWLQPLLEFRAYLAETINPMHKLKYRDIKGRDGQVKLKKDGTYAARTYKLDTSRTMLEKLLHTQLAIQQFGPDPHACLIDQEELMEIRRIWRTERQDWEDSVPLIFNQIMGYDLAWPIDDDIIFDNEQKALLSGVCREFDIPFDLVARLLEVEKRSAGMARRAGIQDSIAAVFRQAWNDLDDPMPALDEPSDIHLRVLNEIP